MIYLEDVRDYCLKKPEVTECFPFDEDTLVFKVCGKMFLFASIEENRVCVKCDPELAVSLRERYDAVVPGFHMNKKMWNTILLEGHFPSNVFYEWVDHSYEQVVAKLPKKDRERLQSGISNG